jgi:hypothetical protein
MGNVSEAGFLYPIRHQRRIVGENKALALRTPSMSEMGILRQLTGGNVYREVKMV